MKHIFILIVFLAFFICCKSTEPRKTYNQELIASSVNLYAFVGQKISITEFDPNENNLEITIDSISGDTIRKMRYVMDSGFICRYKILENVFNKLDVDTIEFKAYDHYGRPGFEKYDTVLLYISISTDSSHYIHQKYQFDVVSQSLHGSWQGQNGESIEELFIEKKNGVFRERKVFEN